ncbi:MAG: hypothetical protein AAGF31_12235 [Planctomycetota bacterium]
MAFLRTLTAVLCLLAVSPVVAGSEQRTAKSDGGWRAAARDRLLSEEVRARYGLPLCPEASDADSIVLHVHGYNSTSSATKVLVDAAREAGLACAGFQYPNDQPLCESAKLLAAELRRVERLRPGRRFSLVTHSMGGLVARAVIEDAKLDPGCVDRLIMVAPPTQGTLLARVAIATDLWEHWLGRSNGSPWTRMTDAIVDGWGEAATDLRTGSPFLTALNQRPRNPAVQYTLILGTGASVSGAQIDWLRSRAEATLVGMRVDDAAGKVDRAFAEVDELVDGKGDGVVAVRRARLAGVDDTVILPFGHLDVSGESPSPAALEARQIVLDRLLKNRR